MRHLDIVKLIPLSFCIAFAPVQPVEPASSSPLAVTSASRIMRNGVSLGGHTIRTDGGMSVVSIRLPGGERRGR